MNFNVCPVTQDLNEHLRWLELEDTYECGCHCSDGGCHTCGLCLDCLIKADKERKCEECQYNDENF